MTNDFFPDKAYLIAENKALKERVTELEALNEVQAGIIADLMWEPDAFVNPMDRKKKCPACGKMSRVTTAGCDHCDLEDK